MRPTFLIIGAGKCGTTSLCYYLSQHPDVLISNPKEPGYFSENYVKGREWYLSLFDNDGSSKVFGEGTVNYSKAHIYPLAAQRIATDLPDVKIIYMTRHPLRRIVSEWKYRVLNGDEHRPFNETVRAESDYIETSNYKKQLDIFRRYYSDGQVKVFFLEDLQRHTDPVIQECCEFLGIETNKIKFELSPKNVGAEMIGSSRLIRRIRTLPGFRSAQNYLPENFRNKVRGVLGRHMIDIKLLKEPVIWDSEVLQYVIKSLKTDSEDFLAQHGKSREFWDFEIYSDANTVNGSIDKSLKVS